MDVSGTYGEDGRMGREKGVFVIERSPRDREGTIWVADQGTRCVCDRKMLREKSR